MEDPRLRRDHIMARASLGPRKSKDVLAIQEVCCSAPRAPTTSKAVVETSSFHSSTSTKRLHPAKKIFLPVNLAVVYAAELMKNGIEDRRRLECAVAVANEERGTSSCGERTRCVVALARNLHFLRSSFFTGLTAVFVASLRQAPAREVRALNLLIRRHYDSPF